MKSFIAHCHSTPERKLETESKFLCDECGEHYYWLRHKRRSESMMDYVSAVNKIMLRAHRNQFPNCRSSHLQARIHPPTHGADEKEFMASYQLMIEIQGKKNGRINANENEAINQPKTINIRSKGWS